MVIAFYPGSGGNRYLRMLQNLEWQNSQTSYDSVVSGQTLKTRYLLDQDYYQPQEYVLTHCMNLTHIQKTLPGHSVCFIIGDLKHCLQREWALHGHNRYIKKVTIDADRIEHYDAVKDPSWPVCNSVEEIDNLPADILLEITQDFNNIPRSKAQEIGVLKTIENNFINKVNSAYDTIKWHKEYYSKYPLEYSDDSKIIDITTGNDKFATVMQQELTQYCSDVFDDVWNALNV